MGLGKLPDRLNLAIIRGLHLLLFREEVKLSPVLDLVELLQRSRQILRCLARRLRCLALCLFALLRRRRAGLLCLALRFGRTPLRFRLALPLRRFCARAPCLCFALLGRFFRCGVVRLGFFLLLRQTVNRVSVFVHRLLGCNDARGLLEPVLVVVLHEGAVLCLLRGHDRELINLFALCVCELADYATPLQVKLNCRRLRVVGLSNGRGQLLRFGKGQELLRVRKGARAFVAPLHGGLNSLQGVV